MLRNIFLFCLTLLADSDSASTTAAWNGKWFPNFPDAEDTNQIVVKKHHDLGDTKHGVKMGISDSICDDARSNLTVDWFLAPDNYTCLDNRKLYLPNSYVHPLHTIERIPLYYNAPHACMNESIEYSQIIPTFGKHRPLWPVYGEYKFVPKQRWLHSLEHGAVVVLYHPCAEKNEVNLLKSIVRNCLYKHVITPYNLLDRKRPLALVTWGHRLEMSRVAGDLVVKFIKEHALKGPESTTKNGQYDLLLVKEAGIVSDLSDSGLCPNTNDINITM
ncbi:unnamed protein product [Phyllotreta striolata]|uniref:Uncharacterized protein n=1 Tax=Phyllotreta striolata TaxID=444603 RepID=A0A9N9TYI5_PHYSR|nr:unnamed protein product [Phyllotreta striolata]